MLGCQPHSLQNISDFVDLHFKYSFFQIGQYICLFVRLISQFGDSNSVQKASGAQVWECVLVCAWLGGVTSGCTECLGSWNQCVNIAAVDLVPLNMLRSQETVPRH